jgi:ribosomal-protein-alanine N-acetyltransferase
MSTRFVLQPISPRQLPLLAAVHAESFDGIGWTIEQIEGSLAQETTRGWIAFKDDEPSGFILCQMMPGQSEILTLCVRPTAQRRGNGEALVKKAVQAAMEMKSNLFLEVAVDNIAAIKLYEKLGFHEAGRRANYYRRGADAVDAVLYKWIARVN